MDEPRIHDCFISHASEDKEAVARPLANALQDRGYDVWYDEFELEIGDSLREKIDKGLSGSRFGVVVLSERFFGKNWAKLELDALVSRQMIGSERIILPVWHRVDEGFLEEVSPTLASIVGVSSEPLDNAVDKIAQRIDRRRDLGSSGGALVAAQASSPSPTESDPERLLREEQRVRLGYTPAEKHLFNSEGGSANGPGWLSVIVGPARLQDDLIDPTEISAESIREIVLEDQWYDGRLLNRENLRVDLDGFQHRFPELAGSLPDYWLKIWQDGLMEFGETLTFGGEDHRVLPYISMAEQIHDYVNLFAKILSEVGYPGDVAAIACLGDVRGFELGLPRKYDFDDHPIDADRVQSRPLRTSVAEMPSAAGGWLKKTMDRMFLAGGVASGAYFLSDEGSIKPAFR